MLGALFAVAMAVTSMVYANTVDRIAKVEARVEAADARERDVAVLVGKLEERQADMQATLARIEDTQIDADVKLGTILSSVAKNSAAWQALVKDYQAYLKTNRR